MKSTGVRRLVVDVEKKIELWAVEVLSIKAQTSQKAEQRRYGANAQAWGNALLRSALWFGGVQYARISDGRLMQDLLGTCNR